MLTELALLLQGRELSAEEVCAAMDSLVSAQISDHEKAAFLRAWAARGETAAELAACAEALLPQARDPGVRGSWAGRPLLDCCGTGGGALNILNISTGMMFVLAALGIPVVKHGNRGLSKTSGSADVLMALGVRLDLHPAPVARCLEEVGCAFLYAPDYHPAFAAVASTRRLLAAQGHRSVFNLLGPLLNPAKPDARLVGVFQRPHVELYAEALTRLNCPRFAVACGEDAETGRALGEVSAHGATQLRTSFGEPLVLQRHHFGPAPATLNSLSVSDAADSARRLVGIFQGEEQGLARGTLLVNCAMAAWTQGTAASFEDGLARSTEALDSGAAHQRLERWRKLSAA